MKDILLSLLSNKALVRSCNTSDTFWEVACYKGGTLGNRELLTVAATWWSVWLERNRRIFEAKKRAARYLVAEIKILTHFVAFVVPSEMIFFFFSTVLVET